jgi:serine protease Do
MRAAHRLLYASLLAASMLAVDPHPAPAGTVPPQPIADIIARVQPSVVKVIVVHPPEKPEAGQTVTASANGSRKAAEQQPVTRVGSGFAISADGLIATNRHVVENSISIFVATADGARHRAEVVGVAGKVDIALLRIDPSAHIPPLSWGDSDTLRSGDTVIAIGSPFGFDSTVTAGIVSSTNRDIMESPFDDYIQTDAAINHGNSGGPLFNIAGEVVGMNSILIAPGQGSAGLGFAIPSNDLRFVLDRLAQHGQIRVGMLPIRTQQVTGLVAAAFGLPKAGGALVDSLSPGADTMGGQIVPGDVIAAIDDQPVIDPRDLARKAAMMPVGGRAKLELWRNGNPLTVTVPIQPLEGPPPSAVGENVRPRTLGLRFTGAGKGARLADVDPQGSAADSGLIKGDLILRVQQDAVTTPEQATALLNARIASKAHFAALLVERDGKASWMPVALPN